MRQSIINKLNSNNMSKKVIEQENEKTLIMHTYYDLIQIQQLSDFGLENVRIKNPVRTTVAKAIDPEYQKVIDHNKFIEFENARLTKVYQKAVNRTHELKDQNAKLVEALEKVKDMLESPKLIDGRVLRHIVNEALQNTKNIEG